MKNVKDAELTITILHYKKLEKLKKTVQHIEKNTTNPHIVRILNQGYEDDEILSYLRGVDSKGNFEILLNKENIGPVAGRAKLLEEVNTPYVMTLDDDVYLPEGWFEKIKDTFSTHDRVGGVGFPLYTSEGKLDVEGGKNIHIKDGIIKIRKPTRRDIERKDNIEVDDLPEGAMVFKKEIMDSFQFDPNYFVGFGGLDKGLQLKNIDDYNFYINTDVKAIHDRVSRDQNKNEYNKVRRNYKLIRESYLYFVDKWDCRLDIKRHVFYKYICLLPWGIPKRLALFWLNKIKGDKS